ncbi:hypothetical protein C2W64_02512 [Brevibacillus laterosporus]|nr:hypothetical protein [Brevibacillus laterosporus]RAP29957.1 hypothetical protein C2W64_02512 [Brevibacillus laterosporus]
MAKNNDTKSELGKIIVVFGTVLGIGAGSIFWLNQFVFDSKNATAVIMTAHPEIAKNAGSEVVPKLSEAESSEPQPPTKEEVKTLLGKPKSESYVDDETRSLCYRNGKSGPLS